MRKARSLKVPGQAADALLSGELAGLPLSLSFGDTIRSGSSRSRRLFRYNPLRAAKRQRAPSSENRVIGSPVISVHSGRAATKDPKATSVQEMRRPDVQSRRTVWLRDKTATCPWPQSDCEIPIDLRNLQFAVRCRRRYKLRRARRTSAPRFRQTNPKMRRMSRVPHVRLDNHRLARDFVMSAALRGARANPSSATIA